MKNIDIAQYKVIGNDGQEYGPIDSAGVHQWIQEGRANAQTMLKREDQSNWAPISAFPEFAPLLGGAPGQPVPVYQGGMGFGEAISSCFSKYATGDGRASRSEFWYWLLFNIIVGIAAIFIDEAMGFGHMVRGPADGITSLALLVPNITVGVRRMHDVGKNGWWILIPITCIGIIPYLVWVCTKGDAGPNQYGDDPLAAPMTNVPPVH